MIPQLMTFEGRNFDILSGITAPIIYWLAFRSGKTNRPLLIIWNILALGFLNKYRYKRNFIFPVSFSAIRIRPAESGGFVFSIRLASDDHRADRSFLASHFTLATPQIK